MLAATVATLSSASKRPAPSSASPSGTILAQGSQSQPPQRSHTCQNSSPRAPVRPDPATGFAPLTRLSSKPLRRLGDRVSGSLRCLNPCLDSRLKFLKGFGLAFTKRRATGKIGGDGDPAPVFLAPKYLGGIVHGHEPCSFSYFSIIAISCL